MIPLLNIMALDLIGVPRNVEFVSAREAATTRAELPAIVDDVHIVAGWLTRMQDRYRREAAAARVTGLVYRQIHIMCCEMRAPEWCGHVRWLKREISAAKAIRDSR